MDFSPGNIAVSVVTSLIGFFYLKHGKRNADMKFAIFGMLLMVYSYFTPSVLWSAGIGVLLAAGPFLPM